MNLTEPQGLYPLPAEFEGRHVDPVHRHGRVLARLTAPVIERALTRWRVGRLTVHLPDGSTREAGPPDADPHVTMWIHDLRVIQHFVLWGDIGVGESYVQGGWHTDDLPRFVELAFRNDDALACDTPLTVLCNLPATMRHALRRNTRSGSRRNIRAHYDLSNELFALFLDETMTYSSAVFDDASEALSAAQERKFARFGAALALGPRDHVLDIGCGWGGFALFAARRYGCRVTGVTISAEQCAFARERVRTSGLADKIDIRLCDYRDIGGCFTKIVSIEMLEAVGREHWPTFFETCHGLLADGGLLGLQVISMPDHRFDAYVRRCDWIRKHIFPGGVLPSLGELCRAMAQRTPFSVRRLEDIGPHYVQTLVRWRAAFLDRLTDIRALGFDDRFIRTWDYYLASCEGAFRARAIGNLQLVLGRGAP
jgi:cyclopropane-fatty-acyl-phospholipid synthase